MWLRGVVGGGARGAMGRYAGRRGGSGGRDTQIEPLLAELIQIFIFIRGICVGKKNELLTTY